MTITQARIEEAIDLLLAHAKEYQLEGVEITEEDAISVVSLVDENNTPEDAVSIVLSGIRDCLDEGLE